MGVEVKSDGYPQHYGRWARGDGKRTADLDGSELTRRYLRPSPLLVCAQRGCAGNGRHKAIESPSHLGVYEDSRPGRRPPPASLLDQSIQSATTQFPRSEAASLNPHADQIRLS